MDGACREHPESRAVGACHRCRAAICAECAVRRPRREIEPGASPFACKAVCRYAPPPPRAPEYQPRRFSWSELWRSSDAVAALAVAALLLVAVTYEVITHPKGASRANRSRWRRPRPEPAPIVPAPPDVSAVRIGQRYVFDHDGRREVWIIEAVTGGEVRYRLQREGAPKHGPIESSEVWKPPAWELVFRDLNAPRSFGMIPGLSGEHLYWNSEDRWDIYLVKGHRVVFPGLVKENPTPQRGKRVLIRVEPP